MIIGYFRPPPAQRIGGLEAAIDGMVQHLSADGIEIQVDPSSITGLQAVHFHGLWQPHFQALARECAAHRLPFVVSPHGMLEPWAWRHRWWKKWPYYYLRERSFLNAAARLLATSEIEARHLHRFRLKPPIVSLPLGASSTQGVSYAQARAALGWPEEEFVFLYLSRLHPKKGLHLLLAALAELRLDGERHRLVVVGDGPAAYTRRLHAFGAKARTVLPPIDWLPAVWGEAKWTYLQAADLFCLPTHSENFGLAILEACQAGTPVLTTVQTPWATFLATHGLPVARPEKNSLVAALKTCLQRGKSTAVQRCTLSAAALHRFGWETLRAEYHTMYRSLVLSSGLG
ncbi:MAG TPA: glycosyltransferase [Chthoniobacterales bacterium]